ncbi:hypothetical protein [Bacillus suaedaesalsae]|uniref:Type 4 fimbrial biogenesis protein PilX N-terminal domain-containing protein n=1 Tax=Bacillus suaedaesalsae TaxID=2810349 RepID=A0ABS2DMP2_9BACI|nr:hypothetical protein [Bacillus suaedaesalsae]MBM6619761.1 hypothetical protein [Bacillus suaedaesalsae]
MKINEQGSTLIITLLTIVVILIFSSVLINTTLNSAAQINKTEQDIQATHLAEMGVSYFHEAIKTEINRMKEEGIPLSVANVTEMVNRIVNNEIVIEEGYSFLLKLEDTRPYYDSQLKEIVIAYQSIGIIKESERIERVITDRKKLSGKLVRVGNGELPPPQNPDGEPFNSKNEFDHLFALTVRPVTMPPGSLNFDDHVVQTSEKKYENSVRFTKQLKLKSGASQYVRDEFLVESHLELESPSTLTIGGNAQFDGKADIKSRSNVEIGKSLFVNNELLLDSPSTLTVGGAAEFDRKLDVKSGSSLTVTEFLLVNGETLIDSPSTINVGGNARLLHKLDVKKGSTFKVGNNLYVDLETLLDSPSSLDVGGSLWIGHKLDVKSGSQLTVGHHLFVDHETQVEGKIMVGGNAYFKHPVKVDNRKGKVCIYGTATFSGNQDRAIIDENATSCNNQPTGTIYVLNKPIPPSNNDGEDDQNNGDVLIDSEGIQY